MSTNSAYQSPYGALYFSALLSIGFYGVTCIQASFYYVHYPADALRMKSFVAALWALDTVHKALIISGVYKYIMAGIVNPLAIMNDVPELVVPFTALVAVPTQGFFVYRIYVFSGKNILAPLIWAPLGIYQLVSTIFYASKTLYNNHGIHVEPGVLVNKFFTNLSISWLFVAAVVDVLVALVLLFLLLRERTATTYPGAAHVFQRLTFFAVNTGLWSATFALLAIILLYFYPTNVISAVFGIPISSVYCNTLLANLNARSYIREGIFTNRRVSMRVTGASDIDQRSGEIRLFPTSRPAYFEDHDAVPKR